MRHVPGDLTFGTTAGCVILATVGALALIVYALLTFVSLLGSGPAQQLVGTTY
jgi:hypothetical protein